MGDYAYSRFSRKSEPPLGNLLISEHLMLQNYIEKEEILRVSYSHHLQKLQLADKVLIKTQEISKMKPIIIIGGIISAIIGGLYLMRWMCKDKGIDIMSNTTHDEDSVVVKDFIVRMQKLGRNRNTLTQLDNEARGRMTVGDYDSFQTRMHDYYNGEWVANTTLKTANDYVMDADYRGLQTYWKTNPNDIPTINANAIRASEIAFQTKNQLDSLTGVLIKNYGAILNKTVKRSAFALGIRDDFLISVGHIVNQKDDIFEFTFDGFTHRVKCLMINRDKDLAVFKLAKKTFAFKDITQHFTSTSIENMTSEGYFVRAIEGDSTIGHARIRLTTKKIHPIVDPSNPDFFPTEGLIIAHFASFTNTPAFIKRGDCGFPLIVRVGTELKIMGIHNAISSTSAAFFSLVSQDELKFLSTQLVPNSVEPVDFVHPHCLDIKFDPYYSSLIENSKVTTKSLPGLSVFGFCKDIYLMSKPRDSHKRMLSDHDCAKLGVSLPTKHSALTYYEYMSTDKLVQDKKGRWQTLDAQCIKYAKRQPNYRKWDSAIFALAKDYISQRITIDYGSNKPMNITTILNGYLDDSSKPFDPNTSGGMFLKLKYNIHDKKAILNNRNADNNARPYWELNNTEAAIDVKNKYLNIVKLWEDGQSPLIVCKDNRKVELLPVNKVNEGKVRLFNELDFHVNMALKRYFGHMSAEVIRNHIHAPWKLGMNPYSEYTMFWKQLNEVDGDIIATDISGCDKSFPVELIYNFCDAMLQDTPKHVREAIAKSLTYTLHVVDGTVYFVDCGNESGVFVTTIMNCYGMEFFYTYAVIKKLQEINGVMPTYSQVQDSFRFLAFGDDILAKFDARVNLTSEDLVYAGSLFNFAVTPAKGSATSFCSRDFLDTKGIIYPALKETSILSGLFWCKNLTQSQISDNLQVVMFEASLHNEVFFDRVKRIALYIMRKYKIVDKGVGICRYNEYREWFLNYVCGTNISPILIGLETPDNVIDNKISYALTANTIPYHHSTAISNNIPAINDSIIMDPISQLTNRSLKNESPLNFASSQRGAKEAPVWESTCTYGAVTRTGSGKTKQESKREAAQAILNTLVSANCGDSCSLLAYPPTTPREFKSIINRLNYLGLSQVGVAYLSDSNFWSINCKPSSEAWHIIDAFAEENESVMVGQTSIVIDSNDTLTEKSQYTLCQSLVQSNANDQPIEPALMNQAAQGQQYMDLPSRINPQPTAINPAMVSGGDDIVSAVNATPTEALNPVGAPNMLGVGAITFDIKELIYNQFIDCDKQITVSDTASEGSIIAQIPYGVHHEYVNNYVRYYADTHERINGAIQYRFTVIGNPLFSGAIGIAWYPNKIATSTAPISELMKYSYQAEGVTTPWNKIHILHDARREHFYRLAHDDESDYNDRPHLVLFLLMSLQNPLKEGVSTRIRIASKLSNAAEPNPFVFSNPVISTARRAIAQALPGIDAVPNVTTTSLFPHLLNLDVNIATDGNKAYPQVISQTPQLPLSEVSSNFGTSSSYNTTFTGQIWGSNIEYDQYRIDVDTPWNVDLPTVALTFWSTNIPSEQFARMMYFMNGAAGWSQRPRTTTKTREQCRVYQGTDLDLIDSMFTGSFMRNIISEYPTTGFGITSVFRYKPANNKGYDRFGGYKIVTTHGVALLTIVVRELRDPIGPIINDGILSMNYTAIDIPITINRPSVWQALPAGYKRISFTNQTISAFPTKGYTDPSLYDDIVILKYFQLRSQDLDSVETLQFRLIDPISQNEIATVRFLQEFNCFAIRSSNAISAFLPKRLSQLMVSKIESVRRTTAFAFTNDNQWIERASSNDQFAFALMEKFHNDTEPLIVTANAMLAAGAAAGLTSGIFGAMDKKAERKQQLTMQNNMFGHETQMQNSSFSHDTLMQQSQFGQQKDLQGNLFNQQSKLQQGMNEFTMDYGQTMAGINFDNTNRLQTGAYDLQDRNADRQLDRNLYLAGARAPVSGSTLATSTA